MERVLGCVLQFIASVFPHVAVCVRLDQGLFCFGACCSVFQCVFASTMIYEKSAWVRVAVCCKYVTVCVRLDHDLFCFVACCSEFERVFASTMIYGEGAWMRVATFCSVSLCVLGSIAIYFASVLVVVCCSVCLPRS